MRMRWSTYLLLLPHLLACSRSESTRDKDKTAQAGANASNGAAPVPCPPGHEDRDGACVDIDECSFAGRCGTPLATCENKAGGYECTCPRGYAGGGPLGIACAPRVVASYAGTCVLPEADELKCWGGVYGGVLTRDYPKEHSSDPVEIPNAQQAVAVTFGWNHGCVLRATGEVGCWGRNDAGQLGDGTSVNRPGPPTIQGLTDVVAIGAGAGHTCAVRRNGELWCWGFVSLGQTAERHLTPAKVPLAQAVTQVTGGYGHTCALLKDGSVQCWGSNDDGDIGTGTASKLELPPTTVPLPGPAIGIDNTAALLRDGRVFWWGTQIETSDGEPTGMGIKPSPPTPMSEIREAIAIQSTDKKCALLRNGEVRCQGTAVLGDGSDGDHSDPVTAVNTGRALALSVRGGHACVLNDRGEVRCWGDNQHHAVGSVDQPMVLRPWKVPGLRVLLDVKPSAQGATP